MVAFTELYKIYDFQVSASTNPVTLTTISSGDFDDNQKLNPNNNGDDENDKNNVDKSLKTRNVVVKSVVRNDEKRLTEKIYSG